MLLSTDSICLSTHVIRPAVNGSNPSYCQQIQSSLLSTDSIRLSTDVILHTVNGSNTSYCQQIQPACQRIPSVLLPMDPTRPTVKRSNPPHCQRIQSVLLSTDPILPTVNGSNPPHHSQRDPICPTVNGSYPSYCKSARANRSSGARNNNPSANPKNQRQHNFRSTGTTPPKQQKKTLNNLTLRTLKKMSKFRQCVVLVRAPKL